MATAGIQRNEASGKTVVRTPEPIAGPFREIQFAEQLMDLWQGPGWQARRNSKTLVKQPDLRIVLTALKARGYVHEHHVAGSIAVQILKGHIRMHTPAGTFDLPAGKMITFEEAVPHDVEAVEDSAYLLTIAWHDASLEHKEK